MGLFLCTYTLLYIGSAEIYVCSVPNWIVGYHFYFLRGQGKICACPRRKKSSAKGYFLLPRILMFVIGSKLLLLYRYFTFLSHYFLTTFLVFPSVVFTM